MARHVGAETKLTDLAASDVREFMHSGGVKPVTAKKRFVHVRAFLKWAETEGLLDRQPLDRLTAPKLDKKKPVAVQPEELAELVSAMLQRYVLLRDRNQIEKGQIVWKAAAFMFSYYSGLRRSEIARLRWRDVDLSAPSLHLREQKNRREQVQGLSTPAAAILRMVRPEALPAPPEPTEAEEAFMQRWRSQPPVIEAKMPDPPFGTPPKRGPEGVERALWQVCQPLRKADAEPDSFVFRSPHFTEKGRNQSSFGNNISRTFRQYRKRLNMRERLNFHALRAGFCTMLARRGASAVEIKAAARHADISTSLRYVEDDANHTQRVLERAFG